MPAPTTAAFDAEIAKESSPNVILLKFKDYIFLADSFDFLIANTTFPEDLDGRTPEIGGAWWQVAGDDFEIISQKAEQNGIGGVSIHINRTSFADKFIVTAKLETLAAPAKVGIIFRYLDVNNFLYAYITTHATTGIRIGKRDAGTFSDLIIGNGVPVVAATEYAATLTVNGDDLTFAVNTLGSVNITNSFNQAQTTLGIFGDTDGVIIDDFSAITDEIIRIASDTYVGAPSTNFKALITRGQFSYNYSEIKSLHGISELGQMTVSLMDESQSITEFIANKHLKDRPIDVLFGFSTIAEADFMRVGTQKVNRGLSVTKPFNDIDLVTQDAREILSGDIFRSITTTLVNGDQTITGGNNDIEVDDVDRFLDPSTWPGHLGSLAYCTVGRGIFSYTQHLSGPPQFEGVLMAQLNTLFAGATLEVFDDEEVRQWFGIGSTNIGKLLLHYLLTTDNGSGHEFYDLTRFDVAFKGFGFGANPAFIDIEAIERLGLEKFQTSWFDCKFVGSDKTEDGVNWLEDNILGPNGIKLLLGGDGRITAKMIDMLDIQRNFVAVQAFDETDATIENIETDDAILLNHIRVGLSYEPIRRAPLTELDIFNNDAIARSGIRGAVVSFVNPCATPFLVSGGTVAHNAQINAALGYSRFIMEPYTDRVGFINMLATKDHIDKEPGDFVTVSNPNVQDWEDGSLGIVAKRGIIVGKSISPLKPTEQYGFKVLTWEAFAKQDLYVIDRQAGPGQEAIDRTVVLFNADKTITLNAEDGFHDWIASPINASGITIVSLDITPQAGSTQEYIKLNVQLIRLGGPAIEHEDDITVRLSLGGSLFSQDLVILTQLQRGTQGLIEANEVTDRVKVQYFERSDTGTPTIAITKIEEYQINYRLSTFLTNNI